MRLLLIYAPGEVVRELCRQGHDVLAVCCHVEHPFDRACQDKLREVIFQGNKKLLPRVIRDLRRLMIEFQPDIVQAFTNFALAWTNLAASTLPLGMRRPRIVSFRGIVRKVSRLDPANWITFYHPMVAAHTCESNAVRQSMIECGFNVSEDMVVYNSVNVSKHTESVQQIRRTWNIAEDAFVVGCIANIRPVKGIDVLVEAARKLEIPDMRFVIVGPGKDERVERLACSPENRGRVVMPGLVIDARLLIHAFDLFVMPSRSEGLCRALIEAMQQGIAPIVSDAGGMKELVRNEIDGIVVPKGDDRKLGNAISRLYHDPKDRLRMAKSAKQRVHELCGATVVASKLLKIYHRLLAA